MAFWTDIIDPATLTGYARAALADLEAARGSLARYLPNREVPNISVRFVQGGSGFVTEANFRAYDAEPEVGKRPPAKRVTLELPAIGQDIPISEYEQLIARGASDEAMLTEILSTTRTVVRAVSDRIERLRGSVLNTGAATIAPGVSDDFGRAAGHNVTAPELWTDPDADRLGFLETIADLYRATNGVEAGSILLPTPVLRALASGNQFATQLLNGSSRPATIADVNGVLAGAGLPQVDRYDRRTSSGAVLDQDRLLLLPAPVEVNDFDGTELGATFWGQTLTSSLPGFELADDEQPGIVVGTYRNEKPPVIAEVVSDAIALPVLANANLSLSAKVL